MGTDRLISDDRFVQDREGRTGAVLARHDEVYLVVRWLDLRGVRNERLWWTCWPAKFLSDEDWVQRTEGLRHLVCAVPGWEVPENSETRAFRG